MPSGPKLLICRLLKTFSINFLPVLYYFQISSSLQPRLDSSSVLEPEFNLLTSHSHSHVSLKTYLLLFHLHYQRTPPINYPLSPSFFFLILISALMLINSLLNWNLSWPQPPSMSIGLGRMRHLKRNFQLFLLLLSFVWLGLRPLPFKPICWWNVVERAYDTSSKSSVTSLLTWDQIKLTTATASWQWGTIMNNSYQDCLQDQMRFFFKNIKTVKIDFDIHSILWITGLIESVLCSNGWN